MKHVKHVAIIFCQADERLNFSDKVNDQIIFLTKSGIDIVDVDIKPDVNGGLFAVLTYMEPISEPKQIETVFKAKWMDENENVLFEQEMDLSQVPANGFQFVHNKIMYTVICSCAYTADMTIEIDCESE